MKILHFGKSLDKKYGGPITGVYALAKENIRSGQIVEIATIDNPKNNSNETELRVINLGKSNYSVINRYYSYKWLRDNYNIYDAVIINGIWDISILIAYWVLKKTKTPYYIFPHGMLDPVFKRLYPIKNIKKYIAWVLIYSKACKYAKATLFTCDEELKTARNSFKPYELVESNIHYGVERPPLNSSTLTDLFYNSYPNLKNKKIILFLSRIHNKKGLDILIEAMPILLKKFINIHLIVAGDGDANYVSKLKSRAKVLQVHQSISWTGNVYEEDKWQLFYNSDVFCLPTHQENFGIAIVEALACGLPVVSTKHVNIWPTIEGYQAGIFGEDNLQDIVKNLSSYLTLRSDEALEMKKKSIICYNDNFSIVNFSKNFIRVICE